MVQWIVQRRRGLTGRPELMPPFTKVWLEPVELRVWILTQKVHSFQNLQEKTMLEFSSKGGSPAPFQNLYACMPEPLCLYA